MVKTLFQIKKTSKIPKITFEKAVLIFFKIAPYIKLIKKIKEEYKGNSDVGLFFDIVKNLLEQTSEEDLYYIFSIILEEDIEVIKKKDIKELIHLVPRIIYENDLYSLYKVFETLGLYDG